MNLWKNLGACCVMLLLAGSAAAAKQSVTLCHVPPGDPSNVHEIVISESAVKAHLKNHPGDQVGTCQERCESVGACDDANACTIDLCNPDGSCDNSQPVDCADGNLCTVDACDPEAGCVNPPVPDAEQVACDDGNSCSSDDVCVAGACTGSAVSGCCTSDADCPASDACAARYCDDATRACVEVDLASQCSAGACEVAFCDPLDGCGVASATCPSDGNICTVAQCNPDICGEAGACESLPNPNPPEPNFELTCDDGLDNDCDGRADQTDPDCEVAECDPFDTLFLNGEDWAHSGDALGAEFACFQELEAAGCFDEAFDICSPLSSLPSSSCTVCLLEQNLPGGFCGSCVFEMEQLSVLVECPHTFETCEAQ